MADIKIKEKNTLKIKKFDKVVVYSQKMKSNIVEVKNKVNYNRNEEDTPNEYSSNQISEATSIVFHRGANKFNEYGQKSVEETKQNIDNVKQKIKKKIEKRKSIKKNVKDIKVKNNKNIIKKNTNYTKKTLKNAPKTSKNSLKRTKKTAEETVKGAKKTYQIAKFTAEKTAQSIKKAIKATISSIKAIISGIKALIALLIAGGWIALIIIIVICLIAMLVGSVFGIFFSSENGSTITVDGTQKIVTMNQVISDLNMEFMNKITQIQQENPYDEYDITGSRAEWKDILAVYVARVSNGNNQVEMMTLTDDKVKTLKEIFWEMNEVTFTKEEESHQEVIVHLTWTEYKTVTHTKLHININHKTAVEMAEQYNFNQEQRNQLTEFSGEQYASMWTAVIYGSSVGSGDIIEVARQQIGNVGGQPYWSWYGFDSRVEWCACFVSWCANECRIYRVWSNTKIC